MITSGLYSLETIVDAIHEADFWEWMRAVAPPPPPMVPPLGSPNYFYDLPDDLRRKIEAYNAPALLLERWLAAREPPRGVDVDDCGSYPEPEPAPLYWAVDHGSLGGLKYTLEKEAMRARGSDPRVLALVNEEHARVAALPANYVLVHGGFNKYDTMDRVKALGPEMRQHLDDSNPWSRLRYQAEVSLAMWETRPCKNTVFDRLAPKYLKLLAFALLGPDYNHYIEEPINCYYEDSPDWFGCAPPSDNLQRDWRLCTRRGMVWSPLPDPEGEGWAKGWVVPDHFPWSLERECHVTPWMRRLPEEMFRVGPGHHDWDPEYDRVIHFDLDFHRPVTFGEYLDLALTPKQRCFFAYDTNDQPSYRKPKLAKQEWIFQSQFDRGYHRGYLELDRGRGVEIARCHDDPIGNWDECRQPCDAEGAWRDQCGPYLTRLEEKRHGPVYRYGLA